MKKTSILLSCFLIFCGVHSFAQTITCDQLHPVVYAGGNAQAIMRVNINVPNDGYSIQGMTFSTGGTSPLSNMTGAEIYTSGKTPYYSPHSTNSSRKAVPVMNKITKAAATLQFTGNETLTSGNNYFWLVYDVSSKAKGKAAMDAKCLGVTLNGDTRTVENGDPDGIAYVYGFKQRVVPYYRNTNLMQWYPNLLTNQHFKVITDIIYFSVGCDANGNLTGQNNTQLVNGLAKLKTLRGNNDVNIVLGIAHSAAGFKATAADAAKRARFAQQAIEYAEGQGYDGIDIDWEYPDNDQDWLNMALLLNAMREKAAGKDLTFTAAVTPNYKMCPAEVFDQLDYMNLMSYDNQGEHSTMARMQSDINVCKRLSLPDYKIVSGLPFYSNETRSNRDWDQQKGYAYIIGHFPAITPQTNTFIDPTTKQEHYFNGVTLIQDKCKYVRDQNLGGVMIWCYDGDMPFTHQKSLARALSQIIKQQKR